MSYIFSTYFFYDIYKNMIKKNLNINNRPMGELGLAWGGGVGVGGGRGGGKLLTVRQSYLLSGMHPTTAYVHPTEP